MTTEATGHMPDRQDRFTLLYDGECPLCRREIEWFCRRDPEAMHVVDISLDGFDSNAYGLASDAVHRELHGIKPDGTITVGMDSVREAYRVIGLGFMVSVYRVLAIPSNHGLDVPSLCRESAPDRHVAGPTGV